MANFVERNLSAEERGLTLWLLQNGDASASSYLSHIDRIKVGGVCGCGCASIDFSTDGKLPEQSGMEIISDFFWHDDNNHVGGVFLFAISGQLAGLDVYSMDGLCDNAKLPNITALQKTECTSTQAFDPIHFNKRGITKR